MRYVLVLLLVLAGVVNAAGIFGGGGGGSSGVIVVAASDASASAKSGADYRCDGTADEVQINAAIAASGCGIDGYGTATFGEVKLTGGTFNVSSPIYVKHGLTLSGSGPWATNIRYSGTDRTHDIITEESGQPFFVTVRDLGLWGKPVASIYLPYSAAAYATLGCGIDGSDWSDSKIINCWADYMPGNGFEIGTWNCQIMYSCAEHCMGYGFKGGSEVIGCHSKYNYYAIDVKDHGKILACYFIGNAQGANVSTTNALNGPIISDCLFDGTYRQFTIKFTATAIAPSTLTQPVVLNMTGSSANSFRFGDWAANTDTATIINSNTVYVEVVAGTTPATQNKINIYKTKTDAGDGVPTLSNLIGHTADYSATTTDLAIVEDNTSGILGTLTVTINATLTIANTRGVYAISLPYGSDKYARSIIPVAADNTRLVNNRFLMTSMAGTFIDNIALYAIEIQPAIKNCVISGNTIEGSSAMKYGISDGGLCNIISDNHIVMLNNSNNQFSSGLGIEAGLTGQAVAQIDRFTPVVTTTTAFVYTLTVTDGITTDTAAYTSDASTTVAEVTAGLVSAWNTKRDAGTALFASIDAADATTSLTLTHQNNLATLANKTGRGHPFYVVGSATGTGNSITRSVVASPKSSIIKGNFVQGTATTLSSGIDFGYGRNYQNDNYIIR